jgi:hypothetical protein
MHVQLQYDNENGHAALALMLLLLLRSFACCMLHCAGAVKPILQAALLKLNFSIVA